MAKKEARSRLAPESFPDIPPIAGVRVATLEAGIRYQQRHDLTLIEFVEGTTVGGVFTRSLTAGHPVLWCRRILPKGRARGVIINAGNANVFRGAEGDRAVEAEAESVAEALGCVPEEVFVASTGVIGERLPVEKITQRVPELVAALEPERLADAAEAILTTDTFPKGAVRTAEIDGVPVQIAGIAKGSGMIAPNMATMLAFIVTDARIPAACLQRLTEEAADKSFNAITVDGDTSTSDTVLLFATQQAHHHPVERLDDSRLETFKEALLELFVDLAHQIVKDGEGAQKFISVTVEGAVSDASARRIGLSIANSPLVKTAIAGGDANWGRIVMAIGKAYEPIEPDRIDVAFGGIPVAVGGGAVAEFDEGPVAQHLKGRDILINVSVGSGTGAATVWTCDLTHRYIDINVGYRS